MTVEQLRNLKEKTYEERNGDQRTEGPVEERNGSRVKQEDILEGGTGFRLGDWEIRDVCGQI